MISTYLQDEVGKIDITLKAIRSCGPKGWLTMSVMDAYLVLLQNEYPENLYLNSGFTNRLLGTVMQKHPLRCVQLVLQTN